jgi:aspartyl-tRNA(Asn)/glutamyl-tRNA(Gln) amidotransferase subunit A
VTTQELCYLTVERAGELLRSEQITSVDLVQAFIDRHAVLGEWINCYGLFLPERALRQARALDELRASGVDLGPLHGIPFAVKDNIDTAGVATTNGSPVFATRVPAQESSVIGRLHRAGAIVLGKANLYEWAYGSPSALFGDVANPWDLSCTAGASSNGSAAAVVAGLATAALGTDLGGSIRIPAAMCGIYGLKPTYGLVSRAGVLPHAQTLDHVGPMTRTAKDAQLVLAAIAGPDDADPVSLFEAPRPSAPGTDLRGTRVGVARIQAGHEVSQEVAEALRAAARTLEELGCVVTEIDLPSLDDARTAMWTISAVDGAEFHLHLLREAHERYSDKARRLLLGGTLVNALEYTRCQRVRKVLADEVGDLFESVDVLLTPVLRSPPWSAAAETVDFGSGPEDNMSAMTHYSPLFNLTGHPAATFLGGFADDGKPIGLQLAAPLYGERSITAVVSAFERATGLTERRPAIGVDPVQDSASETGAGIKAG